MSRPDHQPLFNPRITDDPYARISLQAEKRAVRNGVDPVQAARAAVELRRSVVARDHEPNVESILTIVAGRYA